MIALPFEPEEGQGVTITVLDLSIAETNAISYSAAKPVRETVEAIAALIVGWNLRARNTVTNEVVPVPPPAEAGWEVLELPNPGEAGDVISWIKWPGTLKQLMEKKSRTGSPSTPKPLKRNA